MESAPKDFSPEVVADELSVDDAAAVAVVVEVTRPGRDSVVDVVTSSSGLPRLLENGFSGGADRTPAPPKGFVTAANGPDPRSVWFEAGASSTAFDFGIE